MKWSVVIFLLAAVASTGSLLPAAAQGQAAQTGGAGRTVLDGVYTTVQAERGAAAYRTHCDSCHQGDPAGVSLANPLNGESFMDRWREYDLGMLFNYMRINMPRGTNTRLSDEAYIDILAFILQSNGLPAGDNTLRAGETQSIQLVGLDGPQPLPTGALALVVGCLTRSGDDWILTHGSAPVRVQTSGYESSPEELKASEARPLGNLSFGLRDIRYLPGFSPDAHEGHRMQAKGLMIRLPNAESLSLTSLEMIDPDCGPEPIQ